MRTHKVYKYTILLVICFVGWQGCRTVHDLEVSRHNNAVLSGAEADTIMADMGRILRLIDGSNDVSCNVGFNRVGNIGTFATAGGIINSSADFTAIENVDGNVKIVNQINWCGAILPNVIGCARVPGNSLAVVRWTSNQEDVLWTHEFGHNKNLSHRDSTNAVMRAFIGVNHRIVNQVECNAFKSQ